MRIDNKTLDFSDGKRMLFLASTLTKDGEIFMTRMEDIENSYSLYKLTQGEEGDVFNLYKEDGYEELLNELLGFYVAHGLDNITPDNFE